MSISNKYPVSTHVIGAVDVVAAFLGGGAASNCTIPADGVLTDSAAGLFPLRANKGSSCVYAAATGVYTVTLADTVKNILWAAPIVVSDGAAPTAVLEATCTKITPGATLTIKVFAPNGTLTDLGTSDLLVIRCLVADTSAVNAST